VSDTFERHLEVLKIVANQLKIANLTINVEKSHFCLKEVNYLGHLIGNGTISTDPDKIEATTKFPVPRSIKQVHRFLGLTGWYNKFIRNYVALAAPLTDTLKHKRSFSWSEEAQKSFELLKTHISTATLLHSPNVNTPFSIHCDAINTGVGAVLMQNNDKGDEVPAAFMSKKLNKPNETIQSTKKNVWQQF